jgi:hypothetical protein
MYLTHAHVTHFAITIQAHIGKPIIHWQTIVKYDSHQSRHFARPKMVSHSPKQVGTPFDALPSPGVNPLEGSPMWSCGIGTRKGALDFQHYKGVEGRARSPGIRLRRRTSKSSLILHPKQTTK